MGLWYVCLEVENEKSNLVTNYLLTIERTNVPVLDTICMDMAKLMNFITLSCPKSKLHTIVSSVALRFECSHLHSAGQHRQHESSIILICIPAIRLSCSKSAADYQPWVIWVMVTIGSFCYPLKNSICICVSIKEPFFQICCSGQYF